MKAGQSSVRIGIVCLSAIADDPRVRRQGDLFAQHGWEVLAFGLPGARSVAPSWRIFEAGQPAGAAVTVTDHAPLVVVPVTEALAVSLPGILKRAWLWIYWRCLRRFILAILGEYGTRALSRTRHRARRLADVLRVYIDPLHASATYWTLNDNFARLITLARSHKVDIWLANDWTAMPIVQTLAVEQGVPYAYDTHELAVDEYAQRWRWRVFQRPVIAAIERNGIAGCAVTTCVSQGIATRLQQLYSLKEGPTVIRNMPRYEAHGLRPSGSTIEVLYHGVVSPGRGLETCIESVSLWRREFRLTIRGPASADYLASLGALIEKHGVQGRVVLAPPVAMVDLVKEAAAFDIGLFALPGHSQQNFHVLPNKFFEYTMAGLALCVSDLPEMTALVRQHDLGHLIPEVTPAAIAKAINGFDHAEIDRCKANSLAAATSLNWEVEADHYFRIVDRVVQSARAEVVHAS
ncbi:glycosyltransferase [Bosea sp. (in: a-proteobacteria)]|uniref:glycosyltransferase n=1 Tax=Bosea sp. (in: a-proteobacteria) TaxID=1871050 RepID=UPI0025BE4D20|nr:glycosyltransferase [Bosea sp. (in: a-proteobacteria)]